MKLSVDISINNTQKILRTVKKWGDPAMPSYSTAVVGTSNFQAIQLYIGVGETGWSGVHSGLHIPHSDIEKVKAMQINDGYTPYEKMQWLASSPKKSKIYWWPTPDTNWETDELVWGIIALGGNIVQVERYEIIGEMAMARLVAFTPSDWSKPLNELLSTGLVHRCYCAYRTPVENSPGDTPNGIIYSPFFSPNHSWRYTEQATGIPEAYWIPTTWLE